MSTNEETLINGAARGNNEASAQENAQGKKDSALWKKVGFGTATGILMGAGAMYATNAYAAGKGDDAAAASQPGGAAQPHDVEVAHVSEGASFTDAFNSARAQVGPGGVFRWHGGIYNTYTEDEWNAMSDADKAGFAQAVRPEVRASQIAAEQMSAEHPQVVVVVQQQPAAAGGNAQGNSGEGTHHVSNDGGDAEQPAHEYLSEMESSDVHVVSRGYISGHQAAGVDVDGDHNADMVVIDADDDGKLSVDDVVVYPDRSMDTVGNIAQQARQQADDGGQGFKTSYEEPNPDTDPNAQQQTGYEDGGGLADPSAGIDGADDAMMQSI